MSHRIYLSLTITLIFAANMLPCWPATEIFFPNLMFQATQLSQEKNPQYKDLTQVFLNPAALAGATHWQTQLSGGQQIFDASTVTLSGLYPLSDNETIGFGYHYLSRGDIQVTSFNTFKPIVTGTISDAYHILSLSYGKVLNDGFKGGVLLRVLGRTLEPSSAIGYSADFGMTWYADEIGLLSMYTQNLLHQPLTWTNRISSTNALEERLPQEYVLEIGKKWPVVEGRISYILQTDGPKTKNRFNFGVVAPLHENFSLFGHFFLDSGFQVTRSSIGPIFKFNRLIFKYALMQTTKSGFSLEEHLFSIEFLGGL